MPSANAAPTCTSRSRSRSAGSTCSASPNSAESHCVTGTHPLRQGRPGGQVGTLLYIKPSLLGTEFADLLELSKNQQGASRTRSTSDQWFDETQFESYRALGYQIGRMRWQGRRRPARKRRRQLRYRRTVRSPARDLGCAPKTGKAAHVQAGPDYRRPERAPQTRTRRRHGQRPTRRPTAPGDRRRPRRPCRQPARTFVSSLVVERSCSKSIAIAWPPYASTALPFGDRAPCRSRRPWRRFPGAPAAPLRARCPRRSRPPG